MTVKLTGLVFIVILDESWVTRMIKQVAMIRHTFVALTAKHAHIQTIIWTLQTIYICIYGTKSSY